jgi:purine-cytosine permease-like protein
LKNSGLPVAGVLVIVLSTVTTTYLDAYSCGISLKTFDFRERPSAIICTAIGLLLALSVPSGSLEPFLYAISSIFVPMAAIQITDYFILRKNASRVLLEGPSLVVFLAGLLLYHYLLHINCALGMSIPVLIITSVLEICTEKLLSLKEKNKCLQKQ